jgi:molybdopterin biosynthesis enzyme
MAGGNSIDRINFLAKLLHPIVSDGRESYLRARVTQVEKSFEVQLVGSQDSGVLSSLVEANALIRIPTGKKNISKGELVEVWILSQDGRI